MQNLGVIILDHNCDINLKRQLRKLYTNANMLIRKFFKCSVDVKCYLFKATILPCIVLQCGLIALILQRKGFRWLITNSLRRLLSLPTCNSASEMFAVLNIPSFAKLLRKFACSSMTRISSSIN